MSIRMMANLGLSSEQMLSDAGIVSAEQLICLGSIRSFSKVKQAGLEPSLNLLYALEGAIRNVHWQKVAREDKLRLLIQLEDFEKSLLKDQK